MCRDYDIVVSESVIMKTIMGQVVHTNTPVNNSQTGMFDMFDIDMCRGGHIM